jgi:hypothetical protein
MRKGFLWILGICVFGTARLSAQTLPPSSIPTVAVEFKDPAVVQASAAPGLIPATTDATDTLRFWARTEYLLWWVKNAPLPIPLVSTGDAVNDNPPGALGQNGTRVLLGNSGLDFRTFSGMRFTLGGWINGCGDIGMEASGFVLERRSNRFFAASDGAGNPLLAFPFFNRTPGFEREDSLRISDPTANGQFAGNVLVASSLQLWGAEFNGVVALWRTPSVDYTLLVGFRYMDLQESLRILNQTNDFSVNPNTVTLLQDGFNTRNQFYGGQVGGRFNWQRDRLSLDVTGKLALGATHQVVDIQGSSTQTGPFAATPGTFPGGFFAQPSNIGRTSANQFAVLPSLEMKVGYQITERLRAFVGYDVLYWNQVVRPGNQIDRNVNLTQSSVLGGFGGVMAGPTAPAPLFQRSDFWAQGVTFGVEFRY